MIIENIIPFNGQHCETTATGTLLNQLGISLSEPMLFGLGQGLGFIYWNMKTMPFPFIGGRIKTDLLTQNIARSLNLSLIVKETTSQQKAWKDVKQLIDNKQIVGLKLDCYYLEYFTKPFHFGGHYAAIYGYDDINAYLVDTQQQGGQVTTSLSSLALARAAKGPMTSKNLYYTLQFTDKKINIEKGIINAIKNNATDYLNPSIKNISYQGILKTSTEIAKWFHTSSHIETEFKACAELMEKGGTGGALFRNLYRDFLEESYTIIPLDLLKKASENFKEIAQEWTNVSNLFLTISETKDVYYVEQASALLQSISDKEKKTMELLTKL
ncbi:BtrH N-terminal domain-containing protein [Flavobacterium sp. xlx-214]|uniref:BtrH N-terminal domain-containing protein n=1 Tax=unclassified Flavobacterium TaxID=196869 RepID=UPI0013D0FEFA|nr:MULTISPECIES: BtrH N-terminal domain-containing protein [unclassified Flavobacterium]MBA5791516.1 BtrH N-terminal domain-containing protein [Flavobacterium sp. xlx-221]QMI83334.1 BtrH N-terminal domain-containing protein [Flavobacterium sp. xlx-214]